MEMKIPRTLFTSNELNEGMLYLTVNKPVNAHHINIRLYGKQKRQECNQKGEKESKWVTIYDHAVQLEGLVNTQKRQGHTSTGFTVTNPPFLHLNSRLPI